MDRLTSTAVLTREALGLLSRLSQVQSLALSETMVPAAALPRGAQSAIERHLVRGRRTLAKDVRGYLSWLRGPGRHATAEEQQRRYTFLRLRFASVLAQFDIFSAAVTQRSEHGTGVWLAGLDAVAEDALRPAGAARPPVLCYLDRSLGAAIRRARTRLPGGGENPVAIIRVPRERMIGSGIGSSLIHEVGHQAAALLDLVPSLRTALAGRARQAGPAQEAFSLWHRWISEIVADLWSVATLGVSATMGLMSVVSLPRFFVFRMNLDDPHPSPYIRVLLSAALGQALYPHPQWARLQALWTSLYPTRRLPPQQRLLYQKLLQSLPELVRLLLGHRPRALSGRSLSEALPVSERQPAALAGIFSSWQTDPARMYEAPPALSLAVLGQARADDRLSPNLERRLLERLLRSWALQNALRGDEPDRCNATSTPST